MFRLFIALTLSFGANALIAQSSSGGGTIQGTVKDASGAVIAGAKLTLTNLDTGVETSSVTNGDGFFLMPPVQIGKYKVHCEHSGMKAWEQQVVVETAANIEV